jgi:GT2 family glycosyltransferase
MRKREKIQKKITSIYPRYRMDRVFPLGTRRRRIFDLGISSAKIFYNEGPGEFRRKFNLYRTINSSRQERVKGWLEEHSLSREDLTIYKAESDKFSYRPKFSIILPVYNTNIRWLKNAIDSVLNQCYDNWELCIVDDASSDPDIRRILQDYHAKCDRIKLIFLEDNKGVAAASNCAIFQSSGDFIGFLDHDDELFPHALHEMARYLNSSPATDFIYSDEITINETGVPVNAYYRPDFTLDYVLSHPYFVHFVVIRSALVREAGGFREDFVISQDYDLFLRIISMTRRIAHVPKILYKWRTHHSSAGHMYMDKVSTFSIRCINEFLIREGIDATASETENFNFFRVRREIKGNPVVSIIIPTKDKAELLENCIVSILTKSSYKNFEILIVDNRSTEGSTLELFKTLEAGHKNIRIINFSEDFNFSRLNNVAAMAAAGEHLLFLNNDVEVISPGWIEALLEQSQRDEVCCVGGKLLYPDDTIQHVGVVIGLCGPAEHVYKFFDAHDIGYMGNFVSIRNYSAVTGACMMIKKCIFDEIGGFDEKFFVGFGDTDLCLRGLLKGYLNVFTPYAELYHLESATRGKTYGPDNHPEDTSRFYDRWQDFIRRGDPYYNQNLPLDTTDIRPFTIIG